MSDFDVVRLELATDIHSDPDEAIAALDRIEARFAELERERDECRAAWKRMREMPSAVPIEVADLRSRIAELEAELEAEKKAVPTYALKKIAELEAECEGLREGGDHDHRA